MFESCRAHRRKPAPLLASRRGRVFIVANAVPTSALKRRRPPLSRRRPVGALARLLGRSVAPMLPAWATVLIAIAASAVGGVVGALLQTRHERSEAIRERMIIAAADFSGQLGQALKWAVALDRRADVALNDRATEVAGVEEALREARQRVAATSEPLSRRARRRRATTAACVKRTASPRGRGMRRDNKRA
jgi:hypothetical protein